MIRVMLPAHLRMLAQVKGEIELELDGPVTQATILDALEERYPMLRGTMRDHVTRKRRAFVRFFACEEDLSHESPDAPLPEAVANGKEPFMVVGAIAGGSKLLVSHPHSTRAVGTVLFRPPADSSPLTVLPQPETWRGQLRAVGHHKRAVGDCNQH